LEKGDAESKPRVALKKERHRGCKKKKQKQTWNACSTMVPQCTRLRATVFVSFFDHTQAPTRCAPIEGLFYLQRTLRIFLLFLLNAILHELVSADC
jgi:hypothetical protein